MTHAQLRDALTARENTIRAALECLLDGDEAQAEYLLAGSLGTTPRAFQSSLADGRHQGGTHIGPPAS